jgi:ABC-type oligopeptide transport system ATPase subunit
LFLIFAGGTGKTTPALAVLFILAPTSGSTVWW